MPNLICLKAPVFSINGETYFSESDVSFQVLFDNPSDEESIKAYEWYLDSILMIDENEIQFVGQLSCGDHEIGVRILSNEGWSGIKTHNFATCRIVKELLFYGVSTINDGECTTYYILQLYFDRTSKNVTEEYVFSSTPGGALN